MARTKARHATRTVRHPVHGGIPIDEALAPLIRLLWKEGIDTCQCCQEHNPGLACIEFPGTAEACEFLFVVQEDYRVELEKWDEGGMEEGDPAHSIRIRLLVLFPTRDIPKIVSRFKQAGKK